MTALDRLKKARDVVADLTTVVPREKYLRATRALSNVRQQLVDEQGRGLLLQDIANAEKNMRLAVEQQRDELAAQVTSIRVALGRVAVYEGMVGLQPLSVMVDELVRDHEELEARIDAAMHLLGRERELGKMERLDTSDLIYEVARLLAGGDRVPDTLEGLDG